MVSYYEHNLKERGGYILERIEAGESCALCSDAGMPAVSDPWEVIAGRTRPGHSCSACARGQRRCHGAVHFRAADGSVCVRRFSAYQPPSEKERLAALQNEERTVIFTRHRINCPRLYKTWSRRSDRSGA